MRFTIVELRTALRMADCYLASCSRSCGEAEEALVYSDLLPR
jgi:hypothetical protein